MQEFTSNRKERAGGVESLLFLGPQCSSSFLSFETIDFDDGFFLLTFDRTDRSDPGEHCHSISLIQSRISKERGETRLPRGKTGRISLVEPLASLRCWANQLDEGRERLVHEQRCCGHFPFLERKMLPVCTIGNERRRASEA